MTGVVAEGAVQDRAALVLQQALPWLGQVHLRDQDHQTVVAVLGAESAQVVDDRPRQ
ncbi:hypothetical protein ABT282_27525 [Streptomyces sp. NPDC000927]|uniref:hypothetical protein n=1 Tax=Streptomyces sp. NPDC000927 TaxID=3154371 RepID=UPI00332D0B28